MILVPGDAVTLIEMWENRPLYKNIGDYDDTVGQINSGDHGVVICTHGSSRLMTLVLANNSYGWIPTSWLRKIPQQVGDGQPIHN